ncbi:MAG TPA: DNA cytosine methyltransferase [Allosphingosinicella sp.]|nr:DNA cytosine methyltransferase [Allosphingosinicella sp.]
MYTGDFSGQPPAEGGTPPRTRDRDVAVVDLFCGAGGLAYGLSSAGLPVVAGVDQDPRCRIPITRNSGAAFYQRDVADVTASELSEWFGDATIRVLAGCAPCQPFSTYAQSRKSPDMRWELLQSFQRLATEVRPEVVTMENVPGLARRDVWKDFVRALETSGYNVCWDEVDCVHFGVPQQRKRLVLLASLLGPIAVPSKLGHHAARTVRDAISKLPAIKAGGRSAGDPLHVASRLSRTNLKRVRASRPGGTWRDWNPELRAACHLRETGATYPSVYGRMEWDKPAPTVTTQFYGFGNGRFGHPEQNRAISIREAAILQSFPASYCFVERAEDVNFRGLGILIGNAVPPKLGEAIGRTILEHVEIFRR